MEYYNYDSAAVINAVLQDSLPPELKELLEKGSPLIPDTSPTCTVRAFYYLPYDVSINALNALNNVNFILLLGNCN